MNLRQVISAPLPLPDGIYSLSSSTTSSKSVISLLPLTCHIPVIPGFIASRARWCSSYSETSPINGGRVPTILISPFNTFQNCGNSSRLVDLMKFPIPVFFVPSGRISFPITRGSKSSLNIFASPSLLSFISSAFRSSASKYMLLNLYSLNRFPTLS